MHSWILLNQRHRTGVNAMVYPICDLSDIIYIVWENKEGWTSIYIRKLKQYFGYSISV